MAHRRSVSAEQSLEQHAVYEYNDSSSIFTLQPFKNGEQDTQKLSKLPLEVLQEWGKAPRFLSVAYATGEIAAFKDLVTKHGFCDMQLPITRSTLSDYIKDDGLIQRFLAKQHIVEAESIDLDGKDIPSKHFVTKDAGMTFNFSEEIGSGSCGVVIKARHKKSGSIYAIKRLRRCSVKEQGSGQMADLLNEIKMMIRLDNIPDRHYHLAKFWGYYTDRNHVGLITSPAAKHNLLEYLNDLNADPREDLYHKVRYMYGCLVSVVKWLHSHNIKHKDIKPTNILVQDGHVFLIDFGISRIYETKEKTNTEGLSPYTADYAPQEVLLGDWKGFASDIWSLGRTLIDICGALQGIPPKGIINILQTTGNEKRIASLNPSGLSLLLGQLRIAEPAADNRIIDCIELIMLEEPKDRIDDDDLMKHILGAGHQFCGECCR